MLAKHSPGEHKSDKEVDHAIRQILSRAIVTDEVIDIFRAAGVKKPDIAILSDEFLAEIRGMPQRNLAVELPHEHSTATAGQGGEGDPDRAGAGRTALGELGRGVAAEP